ILTGQLMMAWAGTKAKGQPRQITVGKGRGTLAIKWDQEKRLYTLAVQKQGEPPSEAFLETLMEMIPGHAAPVARHERRRGAAYIVAFRIREEHRCPRCTHELDAKAKVQALAKCSVCIVPGRTRCKRCGKVTEDDQSFSIMHCVTCAIQAGTEEQ